MRSSAFKGRTKGTLSIQESDLVQGYTINKDDKLVETDDSLSPISVSEKDGKFVVNHAEAIISKHAAKLLGITKKDLDKNGNIKEGKEFLMLATRIPASSAGSTIVLKVKGVSPKPGNTIAVNAKTSHITGADLDGDMLHLNFLETASKGKDLTESQQAKNEVIQSIIDLYSMPEVVSMLAQIIEFETITAETNKALYGNEKGSSEVNNDLNILGTKNIFETTKGNVPMIGNIAAQNLTYSYLSQGNPKVYWATKPISFISENNELDNLSNTINTDGTGTYYELCNYLNLILDDGKNNNRANFQFIENTASAFIMMIKFGVKPHAISNFLKQANWAQYKDVRSSDISEMAIGAMTRIWVDYTGGKTKGTPSFMDMVIEVYGKPDSRGTIESVQFNLDELNEMEALVLYQVMKDIGDDMYDLGLFSGLDKHFTIQGVSNLLNHHKAMDALKRQRGIADNVMVNNDFIKRNQSLNYELIEKALSENPSLTNGYQKGIVGEFDSEKFNADSEGLLNMEIEITDEKTETPRSLFRKKLGDVDITSDEVSANKMVSAVNLARVLLHADYNIKDEMFGIINSFQGPGQEKYTEQEWADMSDMRKLHTLYVEVGDMIRDMQNVGLFDGHIWLDPNEGILKIRRVKQAINTSKDFKKPKTFIVEGYKFTLDTASLVNKLEHPEQVDLFRKGFASINEIVKKASAAKGNDFTPNIQGFLVLNDLLTTGWGAKEDSSSAVPYMSKKESKKINSYFKNAQEKGNFDEDFAAMSGKINTLKTKTKSGQNIPAAVMNRRIATLAYLGLHDVGVLKEGKDGKPYYQNEFGDLVKVWQKPLGSDPRNNYTTVSDNHERIEKYREQGLKDKNDKYLFEFGESMTFYNSYPEFNMLQVFGMISNKNIAMPGVTEHEVGGIKKKYLKVSTRGGKDYGSIGVPLGEKEYLKLVNADAVLSELTPDERRVFDNRYKAYVESVKKVKSLYKETTAQFNDSSYKYNAESDNMDELDNKFRSTQSLYGSHYDDLKTLKVKDNDGVEHNLDPIAAYSFRRYMEYSFGNHISEKQIADWEKAHGKSFVDTITSDVRNKDISYARLLFSPGDFGKSKPAIAYINKNMKMMHMRFTRNMALVTVEMNEKLDALYKEKFGEGLKGKLVRKWMKYMPIGSMTYSKVLFGNLYTHDTGIKESIQKDGSSKWRDTSNYQLKRSLFTAVGGKQGGLILKSDDILLKPVKQGGQGLTKAELDYLKMYTKYTRFYRKMIVAKGLYDKNKGSTYIPNVASNTWETYHRRGLFGMYYQLVKGDDHIAEVVVEGYNPITGKTEKLDYFSWKAIFMHAPGESFVKVAPVKTKRGVSLQTTAKESMQTMTGPERIKAFEAIKSRAKELYEIGTDDDGNPITIESGVNQAIEMEADSSINRFTSGRSMGAAYITTHNMHLALREYTRKMMFQHGNSFFDEKTNAWHALSWGGDDKALEHRTNVKEQEIAENNLLFTGFEDKMAEVDAAIASEGNNEYAVKYLQKVVKGGLIQQTRNLTHTDSPIKILSEQPEKVIVNFFTQWTMYIALGFNVPAAIGNVLIGKYNGFRQAGGKKLITGESRYWGIGQDGAYNNTSRLKARKMIDHFGILTYRAEELAEGVGGSSLSSLIFYPMVAAENWIQQAQFLGNIPQKNYDAYKLDSNGDIQFKGDIKDKQGRPLYPEVTEDLRITQEQVANMERNVIDVQGRGYSETDIRYIQLYSVGNMVMQFKRWFPTFLADRFKKEDVDDLGNMRVGSLVAANEFINKMYKEGKVWNGQIFSEIKKIPEDHKRDAVYRVWHGTKGMMVIGLLYGISLYNQDDDEPQDETNKLLEKLLGDMLLVGNVPKLTYMTNIPAADTVQNLSLAIYHSIMRTEYERKAKYGDKGDLKATAHFARLLPSVLRKPLELSKDKKKRSLK